MTFALAFMLSIIAAALCTIMAAALGYLLTYILAIAAIVFISVVFAIMGPLWLPIKKRWGPYAAGVYALPLVFLMQLGFAGITLALGYGVLMKGATKWSPNSPVYVDMVYAALFALLVGHRLYVGF